VAGPGIAISGRMSTAPVTLVVDAAALVDLLLRSEVGGAVEARLQDASLHAPAHVDAEILSALGRLHRSGVLSARLVTQRLEAAAEAPIERHPLPELLQGAWGRHERIRLANALYVELAERLEAPLITTDTALARSTHIAEAVTA
jgi:predicted nucleic acid-binding protein